MESKVSLSPDQEHAVQSVLVGKNVFITGHPGTGKSFLFQYLRKHFSDLFKETCRKGNDREGDRGDKGDKGDDADQEDETMTMTATTHLVARSIGGDTLLRLLGLRILSERTEDEIKHEALTNFKLRKRFESVRHLIIDEAPFMSPSDFDKFILFLRYIYWPKKEQGPFSQPPVRPKVQLIFGGDCLQLPPIQRTYGSAANAGASWIFQSTNWKHIIDEEIVLSTNFRQQTDRQFVQILEQVRIGQVQPWAIELLKSRSVTAAGASASAAGASASAPVAAGNPTSRPVSLETHCSSVALKNNQALAELQTKTVFEYTGTFGYLKYPVNGKRKTTSTAAAQTPPVYSPLSDLSSDSLAALRKTPVTVVQGKKQQLANRTRMEDNLKLKVGAQVLLVENIDVTAGLVNGVQGIIKAMVLDDTEATEFKEPSTNTAIPGTVRQSMHPVGSSMSKQAASSTYYPRVEFYPQVVSTEPPYEIKVKPTTVTLKPYVVTTFLAEAPAGAGTLAAWKVDPQTTREPQMYFTQLPIVLGYAFTIHKSQGMTLPSAAIACAKMWECGHFYVALSRVRDLKHVVLEGFTPECIKANPVAVGYYKELQSKKAQKILNK